MLYGGHHPIWLSCLLVCSLGGNREKTGRRTRIREDILIASDAIMRSHWSIHRTMALSTSQIGIHRVLTKTGLPVYNITSE
jgi:hypothetical protein